MAGTASGLSDSVCKTGRQCPALLSTGQDRREQPFSVSTFSSPVPAGDLVDSARHLP